jgi:hypothetical protein
MGQDDEGKMSPNPANESVDASCTREQRGQM